MPFNISTFVLDKLVAAKQGVDDQRSTQLGLIGAILPLGPIPSLVITQAIAQREAESVTPTATPPVAPPVAPPASLQILVPPVTGGSFDDGEKKLRALELEVERQDVLSTTVPKDQVISQNPPADTIVAPHTLVTLSANPGIQVPDVTNQPLDAAQSQLSPLGLTGEPVYRPSDVVSKDSVISQNPAPPTLVSPGDSVTLVVSSGIPLVELPNVVIKPKGGNYQYSEAREILQDLPFIVIRQDKPVTDSKDVDKVFDQDPKPGRVPRETQVTLTVGTAPSLS